jgi:hypothetical protein
MTVAQIKFQVLDVGQGSGNFVEIWDDKGKLIQTILIDLGSDHSMQTAGVPSVNYISGQLKLMPKPTLNMVALTHSDSDHISLMGRLLEKYPKPSDLDIGMVRYGGDRPLYRKRKAENIITTLEEYSSDVDAPGAADSGVDINGDWSAIWEEGGVKVYLVVGNVPVISSSGKKAKTTAKPNAYSINTKSLVMIVEWNTYWFVITGDATAATLAECNKVLHKAKTINKVFMLTLPHHGSKNTIFNLSSATQTPTDDAIKVVDEFAKKLNAMTLSASADDTKHHHPSLFVTDMFAKYTDMSSIYWKDSLLPDDRHFYTAWADRTITATGITPSWPPKQQYAALQTKQNIYSTLYANATMVIQYAYPPSPATALTGAAPTGMPLGVRWEFTIDATHLSLQRYSNRLMLSTRRVLLITQAPIAAPNRPVMPVSAPAEAPRSRFAQPIGLPAPRPFAAPGASAASRLSRLRVVV